MAKKNKTLELNITWELAILLPKKIAIGCKWVYSVKFKSESTIETYKAMLLAKGYTQ